MPSVGIIILIVTITSGASGILFISQIMSIYSQARRALRKGLATEGNYERMPSESETDNMQHMLELVDTMHHRYRTILISMIMWTAGSLIFTGLFLGLPANFANATLCAIGYVACCAGATFTVVIPSLRLHTRHAQVRVSLEHWLTSHPEISQTSLITKFDYDRNSSRQSKW